MRILFLFLVFIFNNCYAQQFEIQSHGEYFLQSHCLINDEIGNAGNIVYMLKSFNFNNDVDLGNSNLYNDMLIRFNNWRYFLNDVIISTTDIQNLKNKSGWIHSSDKIELNEWDRNLLDEQKIILVDVLNKPIFSKNGIDFFSIQPIAINFKEDLALVEYKLFGYKGKELKAYKLHKGKWCLIAFASDYKIRKE